MNHVACRLAELSRETLEEILSRVVDLCYLVRTEGGGLSYDSEAEINGGDLVEGLTELLARHGLTPPAGPAE